MNTCQPNHARYDRQGSTLLVTLMVVSLLLVLTLSFATYTRIALRDVNLRMDEAEARANARMALQIAIGQLQAFAGADQRVTARAEILDPAPLANPYWTGFWTTEEWNPRTPDTKTFLGWGLPPPFQNNDPAQPLTGDLVALVGPGSVQQATEEIRLPKVSEPRPESRRLDGYTYWIGDEGVKASLAVPEPGSHPWNQAAVFGIAPSSGVDALIALENDEPAQLEKSALSRPSLSFLDPGGTQTKSRFHSLTPQAVFLLTDTRHGGSRQDLSTAFELPQETFDNLTAFHNAGEDNQTSHYGTLSSQYRDAAFYHADRAPDLGYVTEVPYYAGFTRGPSWDLVRNFYRLYKQEWEDFDWNRAVDGVPNNAFVARGSLPHSYAGKRAGENDQPSDDFAYMISEGSLYSKASGGYYKGMHYVNEPRGAIGTSDGSTARIIPRSPKLMPVVTRVTFAIGVVRTGTSADLNSYNLGLSFDPYITVMNPYNVPISFDSLGFWTAKFNPLQVEMRYTDLSGTPRTMSAWNFFSANVHSWGSLHFVLEASSRPYTLEPGEVRVLSPRQVPQSRELQHAYITGVEGVMGYEELSGYYMKSQQRVQPMPNTPVTIRLTGRGSWETARLQVYLAHTRDHRGERRDLLAKAPPGNMYGDIDIFDQPLIANIGIQPKDGGSDGSFVIEKTFGTNQIPPPGNSGGALYVGALDVKLQTLREDMPVLSLNPRAGAFDPRDYDGRDRSSPLLEVDFTPIDDISQLQLVTNPAGNGLWGEGRTLGSGGSTHTPLYEVPQLPLTSLSQLQHLDTGTTGSAPSLTIGNSFPHPGLRDLRSITGQRARMNGYIEVNPQVITDMAWACNDALWDRYFFSGINWGGGSSGRLGISPPYTTQDEAIDALLAADPDAPLPLQNPRIRLFRRDLTPEEETELFDYRTLADHLAIFGGFNINSTSVEAWRAVLSSLRNAEVQWIERNGNSRNRTVSNAFSRFLLPVTEAGDTFGAFHELSDAQIQQLAEAMVVQVQTRGPFMGLADFVNRRLSTRRINGTDVGAVGALQAAIEDAGLNQSVGGVPSAPNVENVTYQVNGTSRRLSTYAGTTDYVLQGDVLNALGGIISARSDTFVVRAYGSVEDENGNTVSEAWCEATVQRTPDWIEDTELASTRDIPPASRSGGPVYAMVEENPTFPEVNRLFGRQFQLRSFRWLGRDDI